MPTLNLRRAVVSGGPGVGKTSLVKELARRGLPTSTEVARAILQQPGGMDMRAKRPMDFAQAMYTAEIEEFMDAEGRSDVTVYDRGLLDIVGFLKIEGLEMPALIANGCRENVYDGPIFHAPPWREIYRRDTERIENWEQAVERDQVICEAWREFGYELIELPHASVEARADFVLGLL
ncbi:MAG: AAA family ATPase [Pseudomonadota bacterium]